MEILAIHLGQQRVVAQLLDQFGAIGEFIGGAAGVHDDHLLVTFIAFRVAHQRGKGCDPGAGGQQPQPLARQQRVKHQRADRLGPQDDLVPDLNVLQFRGQRPVRHLDRIELKLVIPVGRGDGIGAQQRLAVVAEQPDHHELARAKAQAGRPRDAEGKQPVGPVPDRRHRLRVGQGRLFAVRGGGGRGSACGGGVIHGEIQCHLRSCCNM